MRPSLAWDLGDVHGTVAIRMPLHPIALDLLAVTGPMAVSSANVTGQPPAVTAQQAYEQLGESVSVYLDGGEVPVGRPSSIIDLTGEVPLLLREGAISLAALREVVGDRRAAGGRLTWVRRDRAIAASLQRAQPCLISTGDRISPRWRRSIRRSPAWCSTSWTGCAVACS